MKRVCSKSDQSNVQTITRLLQKARNKYDNKILEIEKMWGKLKPHDYKKRQLITSLTSTLIDIDKSIKQWEEKLSS